MCHTHSGYDIQTPSLHMVMSTYRHFIFMLYACAKSFLTVVCADVIDRSINEDGILTTTRLVLKKGKLPKWFPQQVRLFIVILSTRSTVLID
jgi:hypothetical protein